MNAVLSYSVCYLEGQHALSLLFISEMCADILVYILCDTLSLGLTCVHVDHCENESSPGKPMRNFVAIFIALFSSQVYSFQVTLTLKVPKRFLDDPLKFEIMKQ